MKLHMYIILILSSCTFNHNQQDGIIDHPSIENRKSQRHVLNIDSTFDAFRDSIIGSIKKDKTDSLILSNDTEQIKLETTYLGSIVNKAGNEIKFLNTVNYYQLKDYPMHASSGTYLYTGSNLRIGYYSYTSDWELPKKLSNGCLYFSYNNSTCSYDTAISFKDSIPSFLFVPCTRKGGNIYTLFRNE